MNNFNQARRGQGFGQGQRRNQDQQLNPQPDSHREVHLAQLQSMVASHPADALTPDEQHDLLTMREEEKLARDVYIRLFQQWGLRPFGNISGSEQIHMDAILALLQHHGLADPVANMPIGQFQDPAMQSLYEQLIAQGMQSAEHAIQVGLHIEELDIVDLQMASQRTNKPASLAVYADLERASRNHLRAFYRWMHHLGVQYQPEHLTPQAFQTIGLSEHENCH